LAQASQRGLQIICRDIHRDIAERLQRSEKACSLLAVPRAEIDQDAVATDLLRDLSLIAREDRRLCAGQVVLRQFRDHAEQL